MPKNKQILMIYFFLILATLVAFLQVGNHGFVNFDDNAYVTKNGHIQNGITIPGLCWAFTTPYASNWHPLTWISHMLDIQLFGLNPQWHHLTNLLFHITNVLLLFFVLHRMTKALWQSAFVAALFALHPLHVESVAWVAERKDVLSTFFWMLTLVAYGYYAEKPRVKSYVAVIAFFVLGLMSKPMLVTLPFVLLLLDYWPLERFRKYKPAQVIRQEVNSPVSSRKKKGKTGKQTPKITIEMEKPADYEIQWSMVRPLVQEKIPLFALAIVSCAATYTAQKAGGAVAPTEIYTLSVRMANALVSYVLYIIKVIWPDNLAVFYPHPGSLPFWQVLGAVLVLASITIAVIRAAKRFPYLPVGWLWFTGTLVPVIGIVQVGGQAMADRYTYVPLTGLFIMGAWGIPELFKKRRYAKEVLAVSSALYLLSLSVLTWTQVGYWHNAITLFDRALNVTTDNYPIYTNRGGVYNDLGNYTRAVEDLDRAIQINPAYAKAFNNRGIAYVKLGNHGQAIENFNRAIEIDPADGEARFNRGIFYQRFGKYRQAIDDYNIAVENNYLQGGETFCNRGAAYDGLGDHMKAIKDYDKTIEINPEQVEAYLNRGMDYGALGNHNRGLEDLKKAARLGYEDAVNFLRSQGINW